MTWLTAGCHETDNCRQSYARYYRYYNRRGGDRFTIATAGCADPPLKPQGDFLPNYLS